MGVSLGCWEAIPVSMKRDLIFTIADPFLTVHCLHSAAQGTNEEEITTATTTTNTTDLNSNHFSPSLIFLPCGTLCGQTISLAAPQPYLVGLSHAHILEGLEL